MARHESDREDLWAEAVALTTRWELAIEGMNEPVLAGFRDQGWFSLYFGQDCMLQFAAAGGLRRVYRDGELFRTDGNTLARLRRHRTDQETVLFRYELTPCELLEFQDWVRARLQNLLDSLTANRVTIRREISAQPTDSALENLAGTLARLQAASPFLAPAIRQGRP